MPPSISSIAFDRGLLIPAVVLELLLGIVIGPHVLGLHPGGGVAFFSDLGLGLLFFFAGYEIDLRRILGGPLRLGVAGWILSLALAYAIGGVLAATGVVLSLLYTGSALATTAIGMLIPILSDGGELETDFGTYMLGAGAAGEFGPILLVTLVLSAQGTVHNALILLAFVGLAIIVAVFAVRSSERTLPLFARTLESSAQLAVRWILLLVFALALLASELGLDLLLGGFAAGVITRQMLVDTELPGFDSKLTAVAFGVFVPFFFVASGMKLDVSALFDSPSGVLKMFTFLALFLVVRGTPALLLYRHVLGSRDRVLARLPQLHAAAAGAGHHGARHEQRPHASLDRRGPRRSGRALDARLPDPGTTPARAAARRSSRPRALGARPAAGRASVSDDPEGDRARRRAAREAFAGERRSIGAGV